MTYCVIVLIKPLLFIDLFQGNSDSISVPQGIHGDAILSDGELSESEEEKSNQKPPPVSMVTRKRRHTDGATGQEEDQTPSSSPLQLLAPPTLLQSDLFHVNCGYGAEVSQTKAATQTQSVDDNYIQYQSSTIGAVKVVPGHTHCHAHST